MISEQSYMFARKWSLVVNSDLRVAVGHPFVAVGGLKEAPWVSVREHVTPFNTAGHLPVACGGFPVPLQTPCGRTQAIGPTQRRKNCTGAGK
jgi:hypothetical protein